MDENIFGLLLGGVPALQYAYLYFYLEYNHVCSFQLITKLINSNSPAYGNFMEAIIKFLFFEGAATCGYF